MNGRLKAAGYALGSLFVGTWAVTAAFSIKFDGLPYLLGPATVFTLLVGGAAALVAALLFMVLACAGEDV